MPVFAPIWNNTAVFVLLNQATGKDIRLMRQRRFAALARPSLQPRSPIMRHEISKSGSVRQLLPVWASIVAHLSNN